MVPKFIEPIEHWILGAIARTEVPSATEVRESFAIPLLNQLKIDAGDVIHGLSETRLGINGPPQSVRHQSKQMGVTRARVYQLLEDCGKVMDVRWPEGQYLVAALAARFKAIAGAEDDLKLFRGTVELFFPGHHGLHDPDDGDATA